MDASLKQHLLNSQGPAVVAAMEAGEARYAGIVPVMADVKIELDGEFYSVHPVWADVDRPVNGGWSVKDRKTADRLAAALRAGVVIVDPSIKVDVNGQSYVSGAQQVMGKYMNADLKQLGY